VNAENYISRCLELAKRGIGYTNPNPLVGCVIVHNNEIISEGWHVAIGQAHAERMAVLALKDHSILSECDLYVNLEPCSHFGKTPPCADLIIENKFRKVFVGLGDPNPLVAGSGIKRLQNHGIEVESNILTEACKELNRFFYTFHTLKRPFVTLKWAESKDGFLAPLPLQKYQISGMGTNEITHDLRKQHSAILVGVETWNIDKPLLNNRLFEGHSPKRFVLDPHLRGQYTATSEVCVFNKVKAGSEENVQYIQLDETPILPQLMQYFYENQLNSLMVEGGSKTLQSFIDANLADEIHTYKSKNVTIDRGIDAPNHQFGKTNEVDLPNDIHMKFNRIS
jgi:diaminohydroxyphosphoribosylaminopyrimidine deaminase / 5-amino-6-(5-phosphoribosylamino)uracil reductase